MSEERMREYVKGGGELFMVTFIDVIRDGGTRYVRTSNEPFWFAKDGQSVHSGYPLVEENKVHNELLVEYLRQRIHDYIWQTTQQMEFCKRFFNL